MHDADARQVETIVEAWAAGVRARDIDRVLRHHASDLLMYDVIGPAQVRGLQAYRRTWFDQFFPWHGGNGKFELRELDVRAGDRVAFATALIDCAGTEDGATVGFTLRLTIGLERRDGEWTIVHEHHSEPLAFDENRIGSS